MSKGRSCPEAYWMPNWNWAWAFPFAARFCKSATDWARRNAAVIRSRARAAAGVMKGQRRAGIEQTFGGKEGPYTKFLRRPVACGQAWKIAELGEKARAKTAGMSDEQNGRRNLPRKAMEFFKNRRGRLVPDTGFGKWGSRPDQEPGRSGRLGSGHIR